MSLSFLFTALITQPSPEELFKGLMVPRIPDGSLLTIMALVGTTIVPYNLFLHASLVSEKWKSRNDLATAKRDTLVAVALGGMVSMAIIVAAAAIPRQEVVSVMDLAKGLEPLYGNAARYFMGIGLFAAGITSAITAPLAAAYVANSCFGWKAGLKDARFRAVWMIILVAGVLFQFFGITPITLIQFAQVANGLLLPVIAIFLLWVVNRQVVMGRYRNTVWHNILASLIILLVIVLGVKSIGRVTGLL
jgi:Mn2+/Fe2+ NRAMP family transporter